MLERILRFSIDHRGLMVVAVTAAALLGAYSLVELPIDAVPDVTNRQVQINALAPSLSPVEVEKLVTFPLETALAGIPGLDYTRSLSRNGFSRVTVVFDDDVDIYFARQQVAERLTEVSEALPRGVRTRMGPISRPGSAKSTCGRSSISTPAGAALKSATENQAGNPTVLTSRRKGRRSAASSSSLPTFAPSRIGSSAPNSRTCAG